MHTHTQTHTHWGLHIKYDIIKKIWIFVNFWKQVLSKHPKCCLSQESVKFSNIKYVEAHYSEKD